MSPAFPAAPAVSADASILRSHVVLVRSGRMVVGFLIPAFGVPFLLAGALTASDSSVSGWAAVGVGLLLMGAAWPLVRRSILPMLAVLAGDELRLEPHDRSVAYGRQPATYRLAELKSYGEIAAKGTTQVKLYPVIGPTMQLADRPAKAVPAADALLPGVFDVLTLGRKVRRRMQLQHQAVQAADPQS